MKYQVSMINCALWHCSSPIVSYVSVIGVSRIARRLENGEQDITCLRGITFDLPDLAHCLHVRTPSPPTQTNQPLTPNLDVAATI